MPFVNVAETADDERNPLQSVLGFTAATVVVAGKTIMDSVGEITTLGSYEPSDNVQAVADIAGQNAAAFYQDNQGLVEGAALVGSTLIPGMAGIKAMRLAQVAGSSAKDAGMLRRFLLTPHNTLEETRKAANAAAIAADAVYGTINKQTVSALAAGVGANVLDAAAFEVASMSLTFASPVYAQQEDFMDFLSIGATNALIGGGVGAAFSAAKTAYGIKKARGTFDQAELGKNYVEVLPATAPADARSIQQLLNLNTMPQEAHETVKGHLLTSFIDAAKGDVETANALAGRYLRETVDGKAAMEDFAGYTSIHSIPEGETLSFSRNFDTFAPKREGSVTAERVFPHIGDGANALEAMTNGTVIRRLKSGGIDILDTNKKLADMTPLEAQARQLLAAENKLTISTSKVIAGDDIASMEKLMSFLPEEAAPNAKSFIVGKEAILNRRQLEAKLFEVKAAEADRMLKSFEATPEEVAAKLNVTVDWLNTGSREGLVARSLDELRTMLPATRNVKVRYAGIEDKLKAANPLFDAARLEKTQKVAYVRTADIAQIWSNEWMGSNATKLTKLEKLIDGEHQLRDIPTMTIAADGSITINGARRAKLLSERGHEFMPMQIIEKQGAKLPATLPDGSPFPIVKDANGRAIPNPEYVASIAPTKEVAEAEQFIASQQKLHSQERENLVALHLGDFHNQLQNEMEIKAGISAKDIELTTTGGSATMISSGQSNNLSNLDRFLFHVGGITNKMRKHFNEQSEAVLNPKLAAVRDNPEARARMMITINQLRTSTSDYVLTADGLLREDIAINRARVAAGKTPKPIDVSLAHEAESIALPTEVRELFGAMYEANLKRRQFDLARNATAGFPSASEAESYGLQRLYVPPVDTRRYPAFVVVRKMDGITSSSHASILPGKDAADLLAKQKMLQEAYPDTKFEFITKKGNEEYHKKVLADYEYSRGMNDNQVDSLIKRKGMLGDTAPVMDKDFPDVVSDLLNWNRRMDDKYVRDNVEFKYAQLFEELRSMGEKTTELGTSRFSMTSRVAASAVKNPYMDMIKVALDVGKTNEYPLFYAANEWVNKTGNNIGAKIRGMYVDAKQPKVDSPEFHKMAEDMAKYYKDAGVGNVTQETLMKAYSEAAGGVAPRQDLMRQIAGVNAAVNFAVLGSDMLQAFNNMIGQVVWASEFKSLLGQINKADPAAGALAKLAVPGLGVEIPSTMKLFGSSASRFFKGGQMWDAAQGKMVEATSEQLFARMNAAGIETRAVQQLLQGVDSMQLNKVLQSGDQKAISSMIAEAAKKAPDLIRTMTGNNFAEKFTRFMSADAMMQLTDIAMSKGIIKSEAEAASYWTAINSRVHGAAIASQRPIMFQGPIGQSLGVFMTFYHNLLQRMFQYSAAGDKGALAALGGAQVTLYGLQGLPAFNAINSNIIGQASGNTKHSDIYSSIGAADHEWLMFGAGSSMLGLIHPDLKMNLYSRGDLNPRHATIVPVMPTDFVLYQATVKATANILNFGQNIAQGADVPDAFWAALEHNGINRPLSGLGAMMTGGQHTGGAKLLAGYDPDASAFAWVTRLAGGKHLDDAIAADDMFRSNAYKAADRAKMDSLGEAMRVSMADGEIPPLEGFMQQYAKNGGDIGNFNNFMLKQYGAATKSQINNAADVMNSPLGARLSAVMGGQRLVDAVHKQQAAEDSLGEQYGG